MGAGLWNLAFGVVLLVGGLSGKLTLLGTGSSTALAVAGGVMAVWGGSQIWRSRRKSRGP
jgi:hypothetical protein